MKANAVILGKGQLGSSFKRNAVCHVLGRETFEYDYKCSAHHAKKQLIQIIECYKPKVIINCIGISDTRYCENPKNFNHVLGVNGYLPKILSEMCKKYDITFVHISTGCLYDVPNIPQNEEDFIVAHCKYVISKWIGEIGCNKNTDLILRPRLYFGPVQYANNLLCKLPKFPTLSNTLDSITSVDVIVEATKELIKQNCSGIFNVACSGYTSMFEIARHLKFEKGKTIITQDNLRNRDGIYLVNSVMDISKLLQYYTPPTWQDETKRCWNILNETD